MPQGTNPLLVPIPQCNSSTSNVSVSQDVNLPSTSNMSIYQGNGTNTSAKPTLAALAILYSYN